MWAIVVGTVANDHREMIGLPIGADKMICGCFRSRIGRIRCIGSFFGKIAGFAQRAINFVCGNMIETPAFCRAGPVFPGSIQEIDRSHYIGINKIKW